MFKGKYNCPDCIKLVKDCDECHRVKRGTQQESRFRSACDGCPDKPAPGEMKVCYCTLGTPQVTCYMGTVLTSTMGTYLLPDARGGDE